MKNKKTHSSVLESSVGEPGVVAEVDACLYRHRVARGRTSRKRTTAGGLRHARRIDPSGGKDGSGRGVVGVDEERELARASTVLRVETRALDAALVRRDGPRARRTVSKLAVAL